VTAAADHVFSVGDRVSRIAGFTGITGTVTGHTRANDGSPLLWVRLDRQRDGDFPLLIQPYNLIAADSALFGMEGP
jgi:hypothetical protein